MTNNAINAPATNHALIAGNGAGYTALAVGADHSICMGNTSADPAFTTTGTPYVTAISFNTGTDLLATYSTGTFTPTITGSTGNPTPTYLTQVGNYTKIGRMVYVSATITLSALTGGTGFMQVEGLPFTSLTQSGQIFWLNGIFVNTLSLRLEGAIASNDNKVHKLYPVDTNADGLTLPQTGCTEVSLSGFYIAAT